MSRVGKKPIELPKNVKVTVEDSLCRVEGPLGKLEYRIPNGIKVVHQNGQLLVTRESDEKRYRSLHGLSRTLIANMVTGVTQGFSKGLEIEGIGYRAKVEGRVLTLNVGYSHPVNYPIPDGVTIEVRDNTKILVKGADKQQVGQVAAEIRNIKKPEPYKGKGIRYEGERIRRKVGKAGA
ncbi:MAG TPA: 50S ribosomal protein L6 [Candidatus Limnocylindrales bacterium]|nr:50S ribosomal protein L6 [Candidatus Limnocylindrales bacterium]